jgi:hypothetical protein
MALASAPGVEAQLRGWLAPKASHQRQPLPDGQHVKPPQAYRRGSTEGPPERAVARLPRERFDAEGTGLAPCVEEGYQRANHTGKPRHSSVLAPPLAAGRMGECAAEDMRQMTAYADNVSLVADAVDVRELERTFSARDTLRTSRRSRSIAFTACDVQWTFRSSRGRSWPSC